MADGIPYSVGELRKAADQPSDRYHRELMHWAAQEIERRSAVCALVEAFQAAERAYERELRSELSDIHALNDAHDLLRAAKARLLEVNLG